MIPTTKEEAITLAVKSDTSAGEQVNVSERRFKMYSSRALMYAVMSIGLPSDKGMK